MMRMLRPTRLPRSSRWIAKNGIYPKHWDDPVVAQWLTGKELASPSGSTPALRLHRPRLPTIRRILVPLPAVWSVASWGWLLLAGLVWFLLRRQRVKKQSTQPRSYEKPELEGAYGQGKPWIANRVLVTIAKSLRVLPSMRCRDRQVSMRCLLPAGAADIKRKGFADL